MSTDTSLPLRKIFFIFLVLGLTAFGGPIAHLALFQNEFIDRRRALSREHYAELLAICQFLPGPTSSQVGFGIGLLLGGWRGALAAWLGFTLPAAVVLATVARYLTHFDASTTPLLWGLAIAVAAIVAHACWGMAQSFCKNGATRLIAVASTLLCLGLPAAWMPPLIIALSAVLGCALFSKTGAAPPQSQPPYFISTRAGLIAFLVFCGTGMALWWWAAESPLSQLASISYRAGSLVFGGGHVVLSLLEPEVVGTHILSLDTFLMGYGITQAMPGPIFNVSSFIGATAFNASYPVTGPIVAVLSIFVPSLLLLVAALPIWQKLRGLTQAQGALLAINAAVVGLLVATLLGPITLPLLQHSPLAAGVALLGAWLLQRGLPAWALVAIASLLSLGFGLFFQ